MSDAAQVPNPPPAPPPPRRALPGCAFVLSLALNVIAGLLLLLVCLLFFRKEDADALPLAEHRHAGNSGAANKVAIIAVEGVILEGLLGYVHKQIDQAGDDAHVKAVVVRINSPGGSITASDELHHRLLELRDGNDKKKRPPRPLIVSMGSMAASGGYYVAMPGQTLFAEPTTMTGSIGVYSSFPNVKELADKYGVKVNTIKQGRIKDSGSPFADMTPHERQVWQDLIDRAYQRFLGVVEIGRPMLAGGKLLQEVTITPVQPGPKKDDKAKPYKRYLADGGAWSADSAVEHKLIDKIGRLDDAVQAAHDAAGLDDNYQVVEYPRPGLRRLLGDLLGVDARKSLPPTGTVFDPARLQAGFAPRLWYLAPGAETSAFFAAMRAGSEAP